MNKSMLLALASGAVFPLVATAVLAAIMPPFVTWVVVVGLAFVAGGLSAWTSYERNLLFLSVRERIDEGAQRAIKAVHEAKEETKTARSEADKALAERLEGFFNAGVEREREWRAQTLADWQQATSEMQAEMRQVGKECEQLSAMTKDAVARHAAATTEAMSHIEEHLAKQREHEAEGRQAALADWQQVTKALDSSFAATLADIKGHLETWVEGSRDKLNGEVEKAIASLGQLIGEETQRQEQQRTAERTHFDKMLEVQRQAQGKADKSSEKLWNHLLNRLK